MPYARPLSAEQKQRQLEATRRWRARNPDRIKELRKKYYVPTGRPAGGQRQFTAEELAEHKRIYNAQYREENRENVLSKKREYYQTHKDQCFAQSARRRAALLSVEVNDFTSAQWYELLDEYNYSCAYCGAADSLLHREHQIPLARGGQHTKTNIVPACAPCNLSKGTKTAAEFHNSREIPLGE